MFIRGYLCIQDNKEFKYVPIRKDIEVDDWEDAAKFMKAVQETNNQKGKEQMTGYLYTLID